ncbi:SGF29 tudor-like domain-containing protein [Emericellopsis atlantica]|uniref:SGF29 tudor-like domain-containing protein n=1 Tax=Emericellopsis atlantica TaxID=2614577 RepID=A0A9P7ZP61_9HYPO|nr:SGF29 tudor-like domain-containing protein [Emericellopsis atlantica]KAG9255709.1 SGF29 tudor-like domain-containing protein [Emericellopsis atlantica]
MGSRERKTRGLGRNGGGNGNGDRGEEAHIWDGIKKQLGGFVKNVNAESDGLSRLVDMDKQAGAMEADKVPGHMLKEMDQLCRSGVKQSDQNLAQVNGLIESLNILKGLVDANKKDEAGPSKRASTRDSTAAASLYDFDGPGESPVPSPVAPGPSRGKAGERASTRDRDRDRDRERERDKERDSIGPKSGSVEPAGAGGVSTPMSSSAGIARSKVVFAKGDSVAFKPKFIAGEGTPDWILGEVAQVVGEGKSRRYKVLDIEPEDQSKAKEYKTSASSMIPITPEDQAKSLADWEPKTTVLALYPHTTTFYKAEVHSMDGEGNVKLQFEGENDSSTLQQVERRFVLEYRA